MQKKALKVGEFYAYTDGGRKYGYRDRIEILALDHPFEQIIHYGYGIEPKTVIEPDVQFIVVNDAGEPKVTRYHGGDERIPQPQRLREAKKVLHTWDAELAERSAKQDQAAADEATRVRNHQTALEQRDLILSLLGHPEHPLVTEVAGTEPQDVWGSATEVRLDIQHLDAARLGDLLNLAYQHGFRRGSHESS